MLTPTPRAVLLCFDGVVFDSDLPVQAFARHLTERLAADQIRPMIAGMRGFLEGKSELIPAAIDLSAAEDGYQAVEILARAYGLCEPAIGLAHQASRTDLAASAWAVEPAEGLDVLLAMLAGRARVALVTGPGDPAESPVIESVELVVDDIVDTPIALAVARVMPQLGATAEPDRLLVIGTRWADQLQPAHDAGCTTALIDRYDHGRGTPTFRSPDLAGLLDGVHEWLTSTSGGP